jgi:hypothetical protein
LEKATVVTVFHVDALGGHLVDFCRSDCNTNARSNCSGGIDGRPMSEYIFANCRDNVVRASSVIRRIARNGWFRSHALLRRQMTEDVAGLLVRSAHPLAPVERSASMVVRRDRDVDPPRVIFVCS